MPVTTALLAALNEAAGLQVKLAAPKPDKLVDLPSQMEDWLLSADTVGVATTFTVITVLLVHPRAELPLIV